MKIKLFCIVCFIVFAWTCSNGTTLMSQTFSPKGEWKKKLHGSIAAKGTNNVFTIKGIEHHLVRISLDNTPLKSSDLDYIVRLEDKNGKVLYSQTDKDGSDGTTHLKSGPCHLPYTGPYSVIVSDNGSDDFAPGEKYTINIHHYKDPDANEPNNGADNEDGMYLATVLQNQIPKRGMISYVKDEDWYRIDGKKDQLVSLKIKAHPPVKTIVDYELGVYTNSGEKYFTRKIDGEKERLNHDLRIKVQKDGPVYFCIWDRGNNEYETTKEYSIQASISKSPDSNEPNDGENKQHSMSLATKLKSGELVTAMIDFLNDEDWYRIKVPADHLVQFNLATTDFSAGAVDYHWKFCDTNGKELNRSATHDGDKGPLKGGRIIYSSEGGDYYLAVWDASEDEFETDRTYTVKATILKNPDVLEPNPDRERATLLREGTRLHGYIQSHKDGDVYKLIHKGGDLKIEAFSDGPGDCPFSLSLYVQAEDNKIFCHFYNYGTLRGIIKRSHKAKVPAGTYYATVYDQGGGQCSPTKGYTIAHNTDAVSKSAPVIMSFSSLPRTLSKQGSVRLFWNIDNATSMRLNRSDRPDSIDIPHKGTGRFLIDKSTVFTINAGNEKGTTSKQAKVSLRPSFSAMTNNPLTNTPDMIVTPVSGIDPQSLPPSPVPASLNDEGPTAVVLVHGTLGAAKQMQPLAEFLDGLTDGNGKRVYTTYSITLTKRAIVRGVIAYGSELKAFIDSNVPKDQKFHLIGYSQGALVSRWYMEKLGGGTRVGKFISLCGTNHGTLSGFIARVGAALSIVAGAPIVLPCLSGTPQAMTAVAVNIPAAGAAAAASGGAIFKSIKDQDIGSSILSTLYDAPKTAEYHAIWFSKDVIVTPPVSAMLQGAINYKIDDYRHLKAPGSTKVHETIRKILDGTQAQSRVQRIDLADMIFFRLVRERDYRGLAQITLITDINKVLKKKVLLNNAEQGLVTAISAASKRPDFKTIWSALDRTTLFKKMQGKELKQLYQILGPIGPVECAIARNSKIVIAYDVTRAGIVSATVKQRASLLKILFAHKPILVPAREKMLTFLEVTKAESDSKFNELINLAGGSDRFYSLLWLPANKARLQKVMPKMKNCIKCSLSGKDGYIKKAEFETVKSDCSSCSGGFKNCLMCNGSGTIGTRRKCTDLRCSKGTLKCSWCKGTMKHGAFKCKNPVWKGTNHKKQCTKCGGDGYIEPKPCTNVRCGKNGAPKGKVKCAICSGKGYKNTKKLMTKFISCPNCKGVGEVLR